MSDKPAEPTIELSKKNLVEILTQLLYRDADGVIMCRLREDADVGTGMNDTCKEAFNKYFDELDAIEYCPHCGHEMPDE